MAKTVAIGPYSAYAIAVAAGYQGTEEEWLASLVGPQGPQGAYITGAALNENSELILTIYDPATQESTTINAGSIDTSSAVQAALQQIQQAAQEAVNQIQPLVQQTQQAATAASASAGAAQQSAENAASSHSAAASSAQAAAAAQAAAMQSAADAAGSAETAGTSASTAAQSAGEASASAAAATASEQAAAASQTAAAQSASAASGSAQAAAASAAAAQQAAQEALGFRTFFSAVTPDENGDLDPSRPMTTPTAASVTVKSKGDRIQSVEVDGFTTQAGTGDPSPANVREIGAAGLRMAAIVYDGSSDEAWTWDNGFAYIRLSFSVSNSLQSAVGSIYCNRLATASTLSIQTGSATNAIGVVQSPIGVGTIFIRFSQANSIDSFKQNLQQNPVLVYVEPADESQATGLYIPVETQGHEYRCEMMELTAPLCAGDKVESCVPSGCDKTITIDGSTVAVTASGSNYVVTAADAAAGGNAYTEDLAYLSLTAGQIAIPAASFPASVTSAQTANAWLQSNPQKVWYQSSAYTEAADLPVQLETHSFGVYAMTGAEDIKREESSAGRVYFGLASKNAANQSTSIICSQAKGGPSITEGNIQIASNIVYVWFSGYGLDKTVDEIKEYIAAQHSAGTPVTIVYKLATPAIYARDPVTLVAVPFTEADETAANQLASTPSTLPYIDSADVPMLLNSADNTDSAAQVMALAANAVPVAGTYVVSSQDGTTVTVSLKAMQDGGDAATLGGLTADQILAQTPTALSAGVLSVISAQATVSSVPVGASGTAFSATLTVPDGYTALEPLYASVGIAGAVANLDAFTSGAGAVTGTVYNLTQAELQNVAITIYILAVKIGG